MEQPQTEVQEQTANPSPVRDDPPAPVALPSAGGPDRFPASLLDLRHGAPANGATATTPSYIYAIGRIEARFPRPSVEKEFAQATGRADTPGLTDRQAFHGFSRSGEPLSEPPVVLGDDHRGSGDLHPGSARPA